MYSRSDDFRTGQVRNIEGVIQFINHGSPADSQSLVKMPAKGGTWLGDEEILDIAKQVIELAKVYVEKKPSDEVSPEGYFKNRFGPVLSTAIETAPVLAWPPAEGASDRLKRLYLREKKLLARAREMGGNDFVNIGLEDLSNLKQLI